MLDPLLLSYYELTDLSEDPRKLLLRAKEKKREKERGREEGKFA